MWVLVNTNQVLDDTGHYHWCDACDEDQGDGEIPYKVGLLQLKQSETREGVAACG